MKILCIECSTDQCLVSLSSAGVFASRQVNGVRAHSEHILPFVQELLTELSLSKSDLDAIAVSSGPGSFTGVRLGVSVAKSLAWFAQIPLIALSSLALNAQDYFLQSNGAQPLCILRDAKMQEVYVGIYSYDSGHVRPLIDDSLVKLKDLNDFFLASAKLSPKPIQIQTDCKLEILKNIAPGLISIDGCAPHVSPQAFIQLAEQQLVLGNIEQPLTFDPIYLRGKSGWKTLKQQQGLT